MNIVDKILEAIKKYDKIIILRHVLPDGDAYGFQFGLRNILRLNWPEKIVKITGQPNHHLDYIGQDFDEVSDEEFQESLVIVGDTANIARIDEPRWKTGKMVIKIDHHPNREPYGDLVWAPVGYCAASEILAEIIQNYQLKMDAETARIIYHGIVTDSDRFLVRFPKPRTLRLAAFLLDYGFDLQKLYETMYAKTENELKFTAYVYQNYQTTTHGVAYLFLDAQTLAKLQIDADHAAYDYVALLGNIQNHPIWAFFCQYPDGQIRVELRSQNLIINQVAEKYGGGGHKTSAGIKIANFEVGQKVVNDLEEILFKEVYGSKPRI